MKIKSKFYYDKLTGEILVTTSEYESTINQNTKEHDMDFYIQLKNKNINNVDFVEIPYGTLETTLANLKSYNINLETNQLELNYYSAEELKVNQNQEQEIQNSNNRISDISNYLMDQQSEAVTSIEEFIIQSELNKVIEGMI